MSASPTSTGMSPGMSTVSRRIVAAVAAAIIAVLTGIAVGLVSPQVNCQPAAAGGSAGGSAGGPAGGSAVPTGRPTGTPTTAAGLGDAAPGTGDGTTTALGRQAPGQVTCSVNDFEAVPAIVGVVGGLAAGAAAFVMLIGADRRRRPDPGRPAGGRARPVARPPVPAAGPLGARPDDHTTAELSPAGTKKNLTDADRAALIRACIYVRDRTTSRALADRLGAALRDAGVRTVEPAGARFDPAQHEAGGAAPSSDPAKIGTIAAVEVPGYADRDGRLLRVPVVTVYRAANEREDR
jgi:hypothetical protein